MVSSSIYMSQDLRNGVGGKNIMCLSLTKFWRYSKPLKVPQGNMYDFVRLLSHYVSKFLALGPSTSSIEETCTSIPKGIFYPSNTNEISSTNGTWYLECIIGM